MGIKKKKGVSHHESLKWLLFLLLPVVKCVITLGEEEKTDCPGVLQKAKRREGENPSGERWKFSLPLYTSPLVSFICLRGFGTSLDP